MAKPGTFTITLQHGDDEYIKDDIVIANLKAQIGNIILNLAVCALDDSPEFNINVRLNKE